MYTAYLLIMTMFAGAGEIVDPALHGSLDSCESELEIMKETVEREWAQHGILRMKGECRPGESLQNSFAESLIDG